MGQIVLWSGLLLAGLFAFAIIGYAVNFGNDNNVAINVGDDPDIVSAGSDTGSDIQNFRSGAGTTLDVLQNSSISSGDETLNKVGGFKGGILGLFGGVKNIFSLAQTKLFGGEQGNSGLGIFLTALVSFIGLMIILYLWKTWGGKNPD